MSGAVTTTHLRRVGVVLALALALVVLLLRQDTQVRAVGAAGSPVSGQCVGARQGPITGDGTQKGREGSYAITSVTHGVTNLYDGGSGQATGRRQHKPFTFVSRLSQATPKLIQALTTNEVLTTCTFKFWRVDSNGVERNYYRVRLTNALVVDHGFSGRPGGADTATFSLSYQRIEWTWVDGGVTTQDDWATQVS